jgi:hypothetical protein
VLRAAFKKGMRMAKKNTVSRAMNVAKTVGAAALGAVAVAATGVVVTRVAGALKTGGKKLESATPELQHLAGQTVTKPLLPKKQKRATATKKRTTSRKIARKKR